MGKKPLCNCLAHSSRPSSGLQPATRTVAGFRSPSFGPPLHQHAPFRHRAAPVSGFLRPSATVAAWQLGPATPFQGRASIPPGVVSTGSGAAVRRDLPGFVSTCVHPCPKNGAGPTVSARSIGVNRSGFVPSPIRITPLLVATTTNCKEKQPPPEIPGSGRCRSTFQAVFSI